MRDVEKGKRPYALRLQKDGALLDDMRLLIRSWDNGARRALISMEIRRNFLEVSADIVEQVDPIFYSDPETAALKGWGSSERS